MSNLTYVAKFVSEFTKAKHCFRQGHYMNIVKENNTVSLTKAIPMEGCFYSFPIKVKKKNELLLNLSALPCFILTL